VPSTVSTQHMPYSGTDVSGDEEGSAAISSGVASRSDSLMQSNRLALIILAEDPVSDNRDRSSR
jgi:hypothetical protein